jgi:ABC-type branched-subunit amino acid transport system permease subunit
MLFTVVKKGAIYALVAVSMNLLNGFTGLFSLGQAGFMLIGAYTYAVLNDPRLRPGPRVLPIHGGSAIHFSFQELFGKLFGRAGRRRGLVLGVLAALLLRRRGWPRPLPGSSDCRCCASRATIWPSPRSALRRSSARSFQLRRWAP